MARANREQVVKTGTFHYGGLPVCKVRIVQTDFRPGSGDRADAAEVREDRAGTFFRIEYSPPRAEQFRAGGGYHSSLHAAMEAAMRSVEGLVWDG